MFWGWVAGFWLFAGPASIAWVDCRRRRIANWAVAVFLLPGLFWMLWAGHGLLGMGWLAAIAGIGAAAGFLLPGYMFGVTGAGDVKYAASLGFYLGPVGVVFMFALSIPAWLLVLLYARRRHQPVSGGLPMAPALTCGFWLSLPMYLLW